MKSKKQILLSVGFAILWVYGLFTVLTVITVAVVPTSVANPVTKLVKSYIGKEPNWLFVTVNNFIGFVVHLMFAFNPSIPVTGFVAGCVLVSRNIREELYAVRLLGDLIYFQPFGILELGAIVFAVSISFYRWKYGKTHILWKYHSKKEIALYLAIGAVMLITAAILEVGM